MPLKWKIFRVFCYLHIAAVMSLLIHVLLINWQRLVGEELVYFSILFSLLAVLVINTLINCLLLEKYYPDQRPGSRLNTWHTILYVLFVIVVCLSTIGAIALYIDIFTDARPLVRYNYQQILFFAYITTIVLTGLAICYFQVSLRRALRRNYEQAIDSFLNS